MLVSPCPFFRVIVNMKVVSLHRELVRAMVVAEPVVWRIVRRRLVLNIYRQGIIGSKIKNLMVCSRLRDNRLSRIAVVERILNTPGIQYGRWDMTTEVADGL